MVTQVLATINTILMTASLAQPPNPSSEGKVDKTYTKNRWAVGDSVGPQVHPNMVLTRAMKNRKNGCTVGDSM